MVSRRRAAGVLVALVASLAACSSRESDQRLVTLDRTRTSPSGEAVAALVAEAHGQPMGTVGYLNIRAPLKPITLGEARTLGEA